MFPPSLAFSWLLWRQHGGGFLVILFGLGAAAVAAAVLPAHFSEDVAGGVAGLSLILTLQFPAMCLLVVFTYAAENADLASRESCFPQRLLRLPVPTYSLAIWPMAYGAALAVLLWLANSWLILGPWMALSNETPPRWWPATLMTAALAWMQAILWLPFGLRWVRAVLLVALFTGVIPLAVAAGGSAFADGWFAGLFASLTVVAWAVGYIGVVHARRGDVPNWESLLAPLRRCAHRPPPRPVPFSSPARGQFWFEWRLTGLALPIMIVMVLPAALFPLYFGKNDILLTSQTLLSALGIPVLIAAMAGGWQGAGHNRWVRDRVGIMSFTATLPMSNADMVAAMLKSAALTTLVTWALTAVLIPSAVVLTGNLDEVLGWWHRAIAEQGTARVSVGVTAVALLLLIWTWKRKVDSLYLGLTGRVWISGVVALVGIPGSLSICWLAVSILKRPETHATTLAVLPWLLGAIVLCRLLLAAWALRVSLRWGILVRRTVLRWLAAWVIVAAVLVGLLAWSVPGDWVARYYVAFAVVFAMPMARLAAAPLALAWNRHR